MKTIFEEMGGSYNEVNGYLIPNLVIQESEPIGKYGRMRRQYLKEQHPIIFTEFLLSEQLRSPSRSFCCPSSSIPIWWRSTAPVTDE